MNIDISDILNDWEYDPTRNVRKILGADGKEKLQIRLELGLLQMEIDGRPDGKRPHGKQSYLEYYKSLLQKQIAQYGSDDDFKLTTEECEKLRKEGLIYYERYVIFFQIGDYARTKRDTERNLSYFDFVKKYAEDDKDILYLEQYRPYLIRMNKAATGLLYVQQKSYDRALKEIDDGIRQINALSDIDSSTFTHEKNRSLSILQGMITEIKKKKPLSEIELLQRKLQRAIDEERFEDAAKLRDQIKKMDKPT